MNSTPNNNSHPKTPFWKGICLTQPNSRRMVDTPLCQVSYAPAGSRTNPPLYVQVTSRLILQLYYLILSTSARSRPTSLDIIDIAQTPEPPLDSTLQSQESQISYTYQLPVISTLFTMQFTSASTSTSTRTSVNNIDEIFDILRLTSNSIDYVMHILHTTHTANDSWTLISTPATPTTLQAHDAIQKDFKLN